MSDNILSIKNYLNESTGADVVITALQNSQKKQLPLLITESYGLYDCQLMGVDIYLLICRDTQATPIRLKKHCELVQKALGRHAAVVLNEVKPYNLQRMIADHVNFIIPGRQLFLPSLLMDLRKPRNIIRAEGTKIPIMAQCMLLYHLEKQSLNGQSAKPIANRLGVSYPTISRAIKWLHENHFIILSAGREKQISFIKEGAELWQDAEPLLQDPIDRVLRSDANVNALVGGEEALAARTMLAEPAYRCWVVSKQQAQEQKSVFSKEFGDHRVEVWNYDPRLLSRDGEYVDSLSLYLSLRNTKDERTHKELNQLMNEYVW